MLIPFLDILCSLIGVLILIIVMVCAAQLQKIKGRTREDVVRAQKYQELLAQQREQEKTASELQAQLADLEKRQKELEAKQQRLVALRQRLSPSAEGLTDQQKAAALQATLDDLARQIKAILAASEPLETEIDRLKKLLIERKKKPDDRQTPWIVRPSGSGALQNQQLFFVEATGAGIVIHKSTSEQLRVAANSVGLDKDYDAFLAKVKATRNAALVFLIRRDGWRTYTRAAGWAEQQFALNTGKIPIPGDGPVDLTLFDQSTSKP
jgi:small-conductance mechanosensitive channel